VVVRILAIGRGSAVWLARVVDEVTLDAAGESRHPPGSGQQLTSGITSATGRPNVVVERDLPTTCRPSCRRSGSPGGTRGEPGLARLTGVVPEPGARQVCLSTRPRDHRART
jgi:hypothetical protein